MKLRYLYILFCLAILAGCKKHDLPSNEDSNGEPVFYIKGEVNGSPVSLQAGVNNYFMYSSHFQQPNNVYVYKGEMKQNACNGPCNYGIAILINDYKISQPNETMKPDSGLHTGHYQFNDGTLDPAGYMGSFTPTFTDPNTTYTWTYSDGITGPGTRYFNAGQTYSVCLNMNSNGCVQSHTNEFRVGSPLQANVSATCNWTATPTTYSFTPYLALGSSQNVSYSWDFADGSAFSSSVTPVHAYIYSTKYYRARLRVSSATDTCYSYYQVPVSVGAPVCHANFNSAFTPVPNTLALSAITVLVTDPSGNVYSTETINQPTGNKIEILSVENYKNNAQNEPTKKVKIKFNCVVKNASGTLNVTNGEAVIAVSYK
ncbi:MAG: PKD domain-containing protein [Bacteroidetes bacterium]|nr:PKD domain-containing protein [Bacteroidota bacterium]